MRERPMQPSPTPASRRVRSSSDDHGSALASCVTTPAANESSTVGTTTAAHTRGRSWVAASTGTRPNPAASTSAVQLSGVSRPVRRVSVVRTTRSTNRASQARRTAVRPPRRNQTAKASTHTA